MSTVVLFGIYSQLRMHCNHSVFFFFFLGKRNVLIISTLSMIFFVVCSHNLLRYQTGALTPLIQYARRGLAPPRPVARPQNVAGRQNNGSDA